MARAPMTGGIAAVRNATRALPRKACLVTALLLVAAVAPQAARAHPHIFVEYGVVVSIGARGVEGIQIAYTFDPEFTRLIVQTFDADGDGTLSRKEVRAIEQKHFSNLREFDYFVSVRSNGRTLPVTPRDFDVRLPRDRATYVFTVPVSGLDAAGGVLEIVVDDPTFYTAFFLRQERPVEVKGTSPHRVTCGVTRDPTGVLPDAVRCEYARSK